MKLNMRWFAAVMVLTAMGAVSARAQGPLTPSISPGPTMRSLQEIWDVLTSQQSQIDVLNEQLSRLQDEAAALLQENSLLLLAQGVELPWLVTVVDDVGTIGAFPSLAFGPDGHPAIAYYDSGNFNLKISRYDSVTWTAETADGAGIVGEHTSLAFGPEGHPAVSYYDEGNSALKFARYDGAMWTNETVDSDGNVGTHTSLAFGPDGQPAISYYDPANGDLKFARHDGSAWSIEIVDSDGDVGQYTSLAFGPDGQPAISHYDLTNGDLKFARYDGASWVDDVVDSAGDVGRHTSLAFGPDGKPAISYRDDDDVTPIGRGNLKFARYDGTAWTTKVVDSGGDVVHTSLAFGSDGQPAIAYNQFWQGNLKFARKGIFVAR